MTAHPPHSYPNHSTATRLLRCPRLQGTRTVILGAEAMAGRRKATYHRTDLQVQGPPPSQGHLVIRITGGMLPLTVLGGHVTVYLESPWGNVLTTASDDAHEHLTVSVPYPGTKVTLQGYPAERVQGHTDRTHTGPRPRQDPPATATETAPF